jgi:hypothetical protein
MTPADVKDQREPSLEPLTHALSRLLGAMRRQFRRIVHERDDYRALRTGPILWDRVGFSIKLTSIEEAPEPLRAAMLTAPTPHDVIRCLIFGPTQGTIANPSPASLLAILEREWIVVLVGEDIGSTVCRCSFAETLLVELTDVLLYGRLRLDFAKFDRVQSVAIFFNTVTCELYRDAVHILLGGTDSHCHSISAKGSQAPKALVELPLKFQNAMARHLPIGQQGLELVYWPPVVHRPLLFLPRDYSPESLLSLTDTHLLLFSEGEAIT